VLAAYLHGSAVLGGWQAAISDVDILVIVSNRLGPELSTALSSAVLTTVPACPGTGLELSAVAQADACDPRPPWRFITHVTSAEDRPPQEILGEDHPGDADLLLHYAVCRAAGWPILGPPATELIGTVDRAHVLEALASELMWGLEHAPVHYGLLNACRALLFLQQEQLIGKTTAGRWAIQQGIGPSASIARAFAMQTGAAPAGSLTAPDSEFIRHTASRLDAAAQAEKSSRQ